MPEHELKHSNESMESTNTTCSMEPTGTNVPASMAAIKSGVASFNEDRDPTAEKILLPEFYYAVDISSMWAAELKTCHGMAQLTVSSSSPFLRFFSLDSIREHDLQHAEEDYILQ
jgi:hypothetical protein